MSTLRHTITTAFLAAALASAACATADDLHYDGSSVSEEQSDSTTRGYFDLWRGSDDQYYFHLEAGNHEILLWSEGYQSRTGALNGLLAVLDNGGIESRYDAFVGADGQHYIHLQALNGQIIAASEGYTTAQGAERAITSSIGAVAGYLEHWSDNTGARFDVFEPTYDQFRFNLHAQNGEVVLSSEAYSSEAAALNGAFAVSQAGLDVDNFEVLEAADGGFYFNLKAENGEIVGTSEVYASRTNAIRGRDDIIALLPEVELL